MHFIRKQAFPSLIDLILLAVMVVIASALYSGYSDRAIRENVEVAIGVSSQGALALQKTCAEDNRAVVRNSMDAGYFYTPSGSSEDYLDRILLGADCSEGTMAVVLWTTLTGADSDPILELSALKSDAGMGWTCFLISGEARHVPKWCRNRYLRPAEHS